MALKYTDRLTRKRLWRIIVPLCAIVFAVCLQYRSLALAEANAGESAGFVTDYVVFWAAARLLLTGGNPFSPVEVFELQRLVGLTEPKPLLMWNPPWTLSIALPFGAMEFRTSQFLWLLLHVFFILGSAQKLWSIYNRSEQKSYLPWIAALTLIPTWFVLILGQISPLILVGIVGFLHFEKKKNYFLAGIATVLISVKPHLLYLFWPAMMLWIWKHKRWRVAVAASLGGLVVGAIPAIIDPAVYSQFIEMYRNPGRTTPFELPAPSLGSLLTLYMPHRDVPIQFLPPLVGTLWFLWHWQRQKANWDWAEQIPILILVSLTLSAYAWTYDYVILLPAVVHGLAIVHRQSSPWYGNKVVLLYGAINACYFISKLFVTIDIYYFWLAPAFLLTYLGLGAFSSRAASATPGGVS